MLTPTQHSVHQIGTLARVEPDLLISAGAGSILGAVWTHAPIMAKVTNLAQHAVVLHLSGSTLVDKWRGGCMVGHGSRIGSVSLVPAQVDTQWVLHGPSRVAHIYIDPQYVAQAACAHGMQRSVEFRDFFAETDEVLASMVRLVIAQEQAGTLDELGHDQMMSMMVGHLLRRYALDQSLPAAQPRVTLTAATLRKVFEHIEDRLSAKLRLSELAALVHISEDHFLRSFKAAVGKTPHQYVLAQRLARTRELLVRTQRPIADIAQAAGFKGASHFSATFRAHIGISPSDWREQHRQ